MPRDLAKGSRGEDVRVLQRFLNFHLADLAKPPLIPAGIFPLDPDGDFGPHTDRIVRLFQDVNRLVPPSGKPDGIVGPITRRLVLDVRILNTAGLLMPADSGFDPFGPLKLTPPSLLSAPAPMSGHLLGQPLFSQLSGSGAGSGSSPLFGGGGTAPAPAPSKLPQLYTFKLAAGIQSFSKFAPNNPWVFSVSTSIPIPHNRFGISVPVGVSLYENPLASSFFAGKAYVGVSVAPDDYFSAGVQAALYDGPLKPGDRSDPHVQLLLTTSVNVPMPFLWDLLGEKAGLSIGPQLKILDIDPVAGKLTGPSSGGKFSTPTVTAGGVVTLLF